MTEQREYIYSFVGKKSGTRPHRSSFSIILQVPQKNKHHNHSITPIPLNLTNLIISIPSCFLYASIIHHVYNWTSSSQSLKVLLFQQAHPLYRFQNSVISAAVLLRSISRRRFSLPILHRRRRSCHSFSQIICSTLESRC